MHRCPNDGPDERLGSGLEHQLPSVKVLAVLHFHHMLHSPLGSGGCCKQDCVSGSLGWCDCPSLVQPCARIEGWAHLGALSQLFVFNLLIHPSRPKKKLCLFPEGHLESRAGLLPCLQWEDKRKWPQAETEEVQIDIRKKFLGWSRTAVGYSRKSWNPTIPGGV